VFDGMGAGEDFNCQRSIFKIRGRSVSEVTVPRAALGRVTFLTDLSRLHFGLNG
jgi:hypothetical protein